ATFFAYYSFFFSSRRRHTRFSRDWSSDVCSSDLVLEADRLRVRLQQRTKQPFPHGQATQAALFLRAHAGGNELYQMRASWVGDRSEERRVGREWGSEGVADAQQRRREGGRREG